MDVYYQVFDTENAQPALLTKSDPIKRVLEDHSYIESSYNFDDRKLQNWGMQRHHTQYSFIRIGVP